MAEDASKLMQGSSLSANERNRDDLGVKSINHTDSHINASMGLPVSCQN
jgi:hypothetical protein